MTQLDANATCKALVFNAAGFRFALPLNTIGRIVHRALLQEDPRVKELLYFENEPLEVVDLVALLTPGVTTPKPAFFVVTEVGRRLAIATEAPPMMMDLPLGQVRDTPSNYQQSLQGLAQQMILVDEDKGTSSVFLLDLQQLNQLVAV